MSTGNPIITWTAEQVQHYLQTRHPEDYNLVDVSQPREYAAGHLPGALLIPAGDLPDRLRELDMVKPTIVYEGAGIRSRAAANLLSHAGFRQVIWMEGGMEKWRGLIARGDLDAGLALFEGLSTPEEHIAMAWIMEGGTRAFYDEVARRFGDQETVALFRDLTQAEEHHQSTLLALYEGLAGRKAAADFPRGILADIPADQPMEGGARFVEAVSWMEGKQVRDILEYAIAIETAAYDRYLVLRRNLADENSRRVFEVLSDEEKRHLRKLTHFLDHFL